MKFVSSPILKTSRRRWLLAAALVVSLEGCTKDEGDGDTDTDTDGAPQDTDAVDLPTDSGTGDTDTPTGPAADGEFVLRLPEGEPPELTLDLDREQVRALFGPVANDIRLLEIDTLPLVEGSLETVKAACGTDWKNDKSNPTYDCNLTTLGQTFRGSDGTWRSSPEFSLIRILTMTPANAEVQGTSVALLAGIADFLRLGGGFGQILADSIEIGRTQEFLGTDVLAQAYVEHVASSHPETGSDGSIAISLGDALDDLAPLAQRFGPRGGHPGLVDPNEPTYGRVFTDSFRMVATIRSNLRVLEGIDLDKGKDYISVIVDTTGPTFDDEVEFDFTDPARFRIDGIAANPTLDLRFVLQEDDTFVNACTGSQCTANTPSSPLGSGSIWARPKTTIEYVIADAGVRKYGSLSNQLCYLACLVEIRIGQSPDPAGFTRFGGLASLLAPPPQFTWELLNEIAQIRLHDAGTVDLAEGEADVAFDLRDIPVGITGAQAAEAVRPVLQEQSSLVSDFLLGDFRKNNGTVDVYWRATEDGRPTLFYIGRSDLAEGEFYRWATPGFFADAALTQPVGAAEIAGVTDTDHIKWQPPLGDGEVYVVDDKGAVYRLDTFLEDSSAARAPLVVEVRKVSP